MIRHLVFSSIMLAICLCVAQSATAQDNPNPSFGDCVEEASLPPETIVSSCMTYINEAYMQNWGMQYVPTAFYRLAVAYRREGKISEAEKAAVRAAKMDPAYLSPWQLLVALAGAPESDTDMNAIDAMIAANPHSAPVLNSACWERAVRGQQLDAAMADCNEAIRLDPASAYAFDSRCFTRIKMGQFANAVADCDAALKLDPKMASSLYVKGVAELHLNLKDVGNADIAAAEAIDPKISATFADYGVTPQHR